MRILKTLNVTLNGQPVGVLERNREGLLRWTPDAGWEDGGQRPRLGLSFLRSPGPMTRGTGLPSWFENLLPETGSALRTRLARLHGVQSVYDSFGLLTALGGDLPGAVRVSPVTGSALEDEADGEERAGEPSPELLPGRFRFSLAGVQMKLSMAAQGHRFAMTSRSGQRHWIVKLPDINHRDLPDIEAATMRWARAAGHEVPNNFAFDVGNIEGLPPAWAEGVPRAYAIERFDRLPTGIRIHHEDFCQAFDLLPAHKFGDTGADKYSLDTLLRAVVDAAGEEEAKKFALRVAFVIAAGNTDAHMKNWSFAWGSADRPALSPVYDQVATVAWPERYGWRLRKGPRLALSIGRIKDFWHLDDKALERHAVRSGQPWAKEVIMAGIEQARAAWPAVEDDAPEQMRAQLRRHWRMVPLLIKAGNLLEKRTNCKSGAVVNLPGGADAALLDRTAAVPPVQVADVASPEAEPVGTSRPRSEVNS